MNQKKSYLVLIGIFLTIFVLLLVYYISFFQKNQGYIILPGNQVFFKNHDKITLVDTDFKKDNYEKVIVVTENKTQKLEFRVTDGKAEFYKENKKIDIEDNLIIAYSPNLDLEIKNSTKEELNQEEMKEVDAILKEHGIIGYENLNVSQKVKINDKIFYIISNLFDETKYDKVFSFAYYYENNKLHYLVEDVDSIDNTYNLCIPRINSLIKFNHGNEKLILSCEYFSDIGIENTIYELTNNIWNLYQ